MEQHLRLVKSQIAWLEGQVARFPPDHPKHRPEQVALYQRLAQEHHELLAFLESLASDINSRAAASAKQAIRDDLSDLPPELLAELSGKSVGAVDPLVQIVVDRGGTASLDEILIDLFRKHGQLGKRVLNSEQAISAVETRSGLVRSWPKGLLHHQAARDARPGSLAGFRAGLGKCWAAVWSRLSGLGSCQPGVRSPCRPPSSILAVVGSFVRATG